METLVYKGTLGVVYRDPDRPLQKRYRAVCLFKPEPRYMNTFESAVQFADCFTSKNIPEGVTRLGATWYKLDTDPSHED